MTEGRIFYITKGRGTITGPSITVPEMLQPDNISAQTMNGSHETNPLYQSYKILIVIIKITGSLIGRKAERFSTLIIKIKKFLSFMSLRKQKYQLKIFSCLGKCVNEMQKLCERFLHTLADCPTGSHIGETQLPYIFSIGQQKPKCVAR